VSRGVDMEHSRGEQAGGVEHLIGGIYDAAVDPKLWPEAISRIAEAAGCRTGVLYEHDTATHRSRTLGFHRFNTEFMRDYVAHYAALDPWTTRALHWPIGVPAPTYVLLPDDEFRRTEFYQDYFRRSGMFYGLGGVVDRMDGRVVLFGAQCAYEDGRFSEEAVALVGAMMPHLKRAYRMNQALAQAEQDRETLGETLHLVPQPVLVAERDGKLVFANQSAARLLAAGDGVRLEGDKITAAHREDRTALAALMKPLANDAPRIIALRRPRNARALLVQAVPLRSDGRWQASGRVVLLIEAESPPSASIDHLMRVFGLTQAEARLWSGIVAGATLAEIAARQETSVNTLRVQLSRLFAKVGVHRQADLVRLALERRGP